MVGGRENESKLMSTGELLEFMVGQFLWYSEVVLPHKFISLMKTKLRSLIYLTETASMKLHPHKKAKKCNPQKLAPTILNDCLLHVFVMTLIIIRSEVCQPCNLF